MVSMFSAVFSHIQDGNAHSVRHQEAGRKEGDRDSTSCALGDSGTGTGLR